MNSLTSNNRRFLPIALILSLLVLGLAACGSDDDPTEVVATDTTPPTVLSISPVSGSMRVPLDVEVTVIFSEAMDTTITMEAGFFAHQETERVWWVSPTELHLVPVGLPEGRQIIVSIGTGFKDAAGNAMADHFSAPIFTTSENFIVLVTDPRNGYSDISRDISPVLYFSQQPNMASLAANISVGMVGKSADLSFTMNALNDYDVQLDFTTELPPNSQFQMLIGGDTVSADGATISGTQEFFFSTGETGDTTAPLVSSVDPVNSQPNVDLEQTITVVFSEPMTAAGNINLSHGTAANIRWDNTSTLKFEMDGVTQGTEITATLDSSFTDVSGNVLEEFSWSFTITNDAFFLNNFTPTNGSDLVSTDVMPVFYFSQRVQTMDLGFHLVIEEGGIAMDPGSYSLTQLDYNTIGVSFDESLNTDTVYNFLIDDTMVNYVDIAIDQAYSTTFMTGSTGDTTGPVLVSVFPPNGAVVSPDTRSIVFEFNEPINARTFEPTRFNVNGMFWIMEMEETNNNQTITLFLTGDLPAGLTFDMAFGDLTDMAGNSMDTELEYGITVAGNPDFFPVNSSWDYFQVQVVDENGTDLISNYSYTSYPHVVRNFYMASKEKAEDPDTQWFYLKSPEFVRFEGYGPEIQYPCVPPVGWMGVSELATTWRDTVISFNDTGAGYFEGNLVGLENVQYMGEGAQEGIYWGDCRHYHNEWYTVTEEATYVTYHWDVWYAPGIGNVKEVIGFFNPEGESQGDATFYTLAIDNGLVGPLKSSEEANWWSMRREMGRNNNSNTPGVIKGFPFFDEQ